MNQKQKVSFPLRLPDCVGKNIRKYRLEKELTGGQLAEIVGISPSFINYLELGKRTGTNYPILKAIANALGRSVEELMGEAKAPTVSVEEQHYRLLQMLEKVYAAEGFTHDETIRQLQLILKISENMF